MPNIKSAKKRVKIIETKTLQNRATKKAYKEAIKEFEAAVKENAKGKGVAQKLLIFCETSFSFLIFRRFTSILRSVCVTILCQFAYSSLLRLPPVVTLS